MKKITLLFLLFISLSSFSQKNYIFKTTTVENAKVFLDGDFGNLPLNQIPNPFEYGIKKGTKVDFILPNDSLSLILNSDISIQIVRLEKMDTLKIIFKSVEIVTFDESFKKNNNQKIIADIPEFYELMNILIAITSVGVSDENMIYKSSEYYKKVQKHFGSFKNEKAVVLVNNVLKDGKYYDLKMDSYSFIFKKNKIIGHPNYHVINWSYVNSITPEMLKEIESFAKLTNFRKFYAENSSIYNSQINFLKNEVNINKMVYWLMKEFPKTDYNFYNIIFSPLVYANQSTNNFNDNNFKEAQLHINFPYVDEVAKINFPKSYTIYRGNILFTELNHNFINPEAEKFKVEISKAIADLSIWERKNSPASTYFNSLSCFEEYMNWALVTLYLYDNANKNEFETIKNILDKKMVENRGFLKFKEFNTFILSKYMMKKPNETIASLYPELIEWFQINK